MENRALCLTFRDNLFAESQSVILLNTYSAFNRCSSAGFPLMLQNSVVSSAYMIILNISVHDGKLLMYSEKRKGPNTEPSRTLVLVSNISDVEQLKSTTYAYEVNSFAVSF